MKRLLQVLAATVLLAGVFAGLVIWGMWPRTTYAEGFSTAEFEAIQLGDTEAEVLRRLGPPIQSYPAELAEQWCFDAPVTGLMPSLGARLGWHSPDECLFIDKGVVVSVRSEGDGPLGSLRGKSAAEAERQRGRPKYILPPGPKWVLRYSNPREVTDNHVAHVVILDGERIVRGTDTYLYLD